MSSLYIHQIFPEKLLSIFSTLQNKGPEKMGCALSKQWRQQEKQTEHGQCFKLQLDAAYCF
jgi:hypothetical protein